MHLKSCAKLVRSELRLDLQQGALLRRGQSNRLPLAALSTNTLRCGPRGGAAHGGASRAKGTENHAALIEDEAAAALDVWSVIRPGHVREKIALFALDKDRAVKGSWDVSAKRRRRTSQIQPLPQPASVTVTLQAAPPSAPPPASPDLAAAVAEDDPKMSVVEMVAFLEQRVTCSPHAKLRSSASITLSRAPPPPSALSPAPAPPPEPRPIEEPESLSVSDMVAKLEKLETRCLRRRGHGERRAVGRVLLAEQQPVKAPPPPSSSAIIAAETRRSSVSVCKPHARAKPSFSTKVLKTQATPTSHDRRTEAPPPSPEPKPELRQAEETPIASETQEPAARSKTLLSLASRTCDSTETASAAAAAASPDAASAARVVVEAGHAPKPSPTPQNSTLPSPKPEKPAPHEEPLPGLLFLTPPPQPCVQSEQRTPVSPASCDWPKTRRENAGNSFVVLSLDLTVQSRTRRRRSPSPSPAPDPSEKRRRQPHDLAVQSEESEPRGVQSERTVGQSQHGAASLGQSEKRRSCPVTEAELSDKGGRDLIEFISKVSPALLSVQSEARIQLLAPESQWQRRRLNRIAQSEKRKSCPVPVSDWTNSRAEPAPAPASDSPELPSSSDSGQSEARISLPALGPDQSEARVGGAVLLRSTSDVGADRRRRRKATRAFSLCSAEGAGHYGEGAGRYGEGRVASEDFLLMRRRVQSLLEPRSQVSYLSLLPHHLLLQILLLLPTGALAALKCSCRYLRLIIDTYDPRPLDALWVCDPRYRDDPCKQCKRRHRRGDVSLCRWHHKPFCQAMPYGPGYWMCCHGDRRDAPGCNVGLHDNRWVPAFHSIDAPLYRARAREEGQD